MAPEVVRAEPYGLEADVYSFGVIVWEMFARKAPWEGLTAYQIIAKVGSEGERLPLPRNPELEEGKAKQPLPTLAPKKGGGEDVGEEEEMHEVPVVAPADGGRPKLSKLSGGGSWYAGQRRGAVSPSRQAAAIASSGSGGSDSTTTEPDDEYLYHPIWVTLVERCCLGTPCSRPSFARLVETFERAKKVVLSQQKLSGSTIAAAVLKPIAEGQARHRVKMVSAAANTVMNLSFDMSTKRAAEQKAKMAHRAT